jgi:poly-gamma-glutamate synthesis protein (capsule biosynthesis protein)
MNARCLIFALALSATLFASSLASPTSQPQQKITMVAVGDILLDRGVGRKIERYGTSYPFKHVASVLSAADLAFGNLEGPLTARCTKAAKKFSFQAKPRNVAALAEAGFDILSLANNHSMDCGEVGLMETMANLESAGIRWSGAGRSRAEAESIVVMEVKGVRVAFVAFSEFLPEGSTPRSDGASISYASLESVQRAVAEARTRADVVVASFHWGAEYASRPRDPQVKLAHAAVDAGADLVLGHHPHVIQGLQLVSVKNTNGARRALIVYSLGNFVFDSPGMLGQRPLESFILRCTLSRKGLEMIEILPVSIEAYRPRPAEDIKAKTIMERLSLLSAELNTELRTMFAQQGNGKR